MAPRCSRLGGGLVLLLSLAHLIFLTPPKLVAVPLIRDYVFLVPLTGGVLAALAYVQTKSVRSTFLVFVIPFIISIKTYSYVSSRVKKTRIEQSRARTELVGSRDGLTFSLREGGENERDDKCVNALRLRHITVCSPSSWSVRREQIGEDFPVLELWSTNVADVSVVVGDVVVDHDQAPFGLGIVQLRRVSSFVRHHKGAVLLLMEGLPGMFSGSTIGFYEQAVVRELLLPNHLWRSVTGVFPVRLLGRGLRLIE